MPLLLLHAAGDSGSVGIPPPPLIPTFGLTAESVQGGDIQSISTAH